jgi:purine-nucleoside phosphorylase
MFELIKEVAAFLRSKGIDSPDTGIVLGTGLGKMVSEIEIEVAIDYADIPHFPVSTVESHKGRLIYGNLLGHKVLAMQGRFHLYEGYSMQQVTLPIRVMKLLGVKWLLLSNACGAINKSYQKGDLMLLDDHINLLPENPLTGANINELGPRFPDMSCPYSPDINNKMEAAAKLLNLTLHKGVYAVVSGPNLETRAEYRYLGRIGADVVGMSTVPEVIVANHMELPCAAVSVITDLCDPDNLVPAKLEDILETAGKAEVNLIRLFNEVIKSLETPSYAEV